MDLFINSIKTSRIFYYIPINNITDMLMLTSKTIETKINNYLTKNNIEFNYKFSEDLKYNKVFQSQLCKADLLEYWSDRLTDCSETKINNILKEEFNEVEKHAGWSMKEYVAQKYQPVSLSKTDYDWWLSKNMEKLNKRFSK